MKYSVLIFCLIAAEVIGQNLSNKKNFQIGIYGLQSPVGTTGYGNGKLDEIEADVNLVKSDINAAVAMRSWNRKKYPKWDFFSFFSNYLLEMYGLTKDLEGKSGVQVLTPSLYWIFADPPIDGTNEDEKGFDRLLNRKLLRDFIFRILDDEFNIVSGAVNDSCKTVEILLNNKERPLLGWYLDDEPLIRNHDISVLIEMSWFIREIEKEFYLNHLVLGKYPSKLENYHRPRYIAFDGDDLHGHRQSGRAKDALSYNVNGKQIRFSPKQIYTIFPEDVLDVILIDFYNPDPGFWKKIVHDFNLEYEKLDRNKPELMAIIPAHHKKIYKSSYESSFYLRTISELNQLNLDGVWIYTWHGSDDRVGAKNLWNTEGVNLRQNVRELKRVD